MKRLFTSLPLTLILVGCGSSATQDVAANSIVANASTASAATAATTAPASADTAKDSGAKVSDAKDNSAPTTPTGSYKVVDEAKPDMSEAAMAELKKDALAPPPATMKVPAKARIRLQTSQGPITIELNGKEAPLHVKSFLYLAKKGFYNGTVFHRYIPDFVIQGGDPLTKNPKLKEYFGRGGPGYQVPREHNNLTHESFVLAMARTADPDSAGSQFYITLAPQPNLDQGDGYTVFGKVVDGNATVLKLRQDDTLKSVAVLK